MGYAAAKAFLEAEKPYHVIAAARSQQKAQDTVDALKKESPNAKNKIDSIAIDVTKDESIEAAFEWVNSNIGRLDTLINNAGATFDIEYINGRCSLPRLLQQVV